MSEGWREGGREGWMEGGKEGRREREGGKEREGALHAHANTKNYPSIHVTYCYLCLLMCVCGVNMFYVLL